ncbi:hypothetical protein [Tenacibaculum sp. 190524A02b]|uniref:leucine-rich repeat domain-containing protein n=1 Tax=Tenacibaculum vairaonense TaxID=3137860 RepID=UPI0031FB55A0
MKNYIIIFLLMFVSFLNGQTTTIPDSNFEQALIDQGIDTNGLNGNILNTDAVSVLILNLNNKMIRDYSGIEAFANLEELYTKGNFARTLDLRSNPRLRIIDCSDSDIIDLKISNCPLIEILECQGNFIHNLNITNNSFLRELKCQSNFLSILEVSNNTLLTELNCSNNRIETLDVSNSNNLNTLDCSSNNVLTNLTIGTNTVITDLFTSNNQLNSLDLTDTSNLDRLEVANNNLTEINITNNTSIRVLDASNNNISEINLASNSSLIELNLNNNQISSLDITSNTSLRSLKVAFNSLRILDTTTATSLFSLHCNDNTINILDLSNNIISGLHAQNNNLTSLNLTGSAPNPSAYDITNNPLLNFVCVSSASWSDLNLTNKDSHTTYTEDCSLLEPSSFIADTAFEQKLIDNSIDTSGLDNLIYHSDTNGITSLNVSTSGITDLTGISAFQDLSVLNCNENQLTYIDLSKNTSLKNLNVSDNELTYLNTDNNASLQILNAKSNNLVEVNVESSIKLTELQLGLNPIREINLSANTSLQIIDFTSSLIQELDLSNNNKLFYINLRNARALKALNVQNGSNTIITTFNTQNTESLHCIKVDAPTYSKTNWTLINSTNHFNTSCNISLTAKVYLKGAASFDEELLMRDDLRINGVIPTTSPYSDQLNCKPSILTITGDNAIVDWVLIKLIKPSDLSTVMYEQSALLQRNGNIVNVDGISTISFFMQAQKYHVAIFHRNHIPITTNTSISLSNIPTNIDFTNVSNVLGNTNAVTEIQTGKYALFAGNVDGNNQIQTPDITTMISNIGQSGYSTSDVNMNGQIQTTDIPLIISLVGSGKQF